MKRFAACLILLFASGCDAPLTVEQRIIAEIRDMEASIEARERGRFMAHVAEDFLGQGGAMNRQQLRAYMVLQLRRFDDIEARLMPITVTEISDQEARADFRALLTGGAGWLPESGQLYRITTHWRLKNGDWLLIAARWEPTSL